MDDCLWSAAPSDEELAEYEQERPARRLRPVLDLVAAVWCAIVSIGVLLQVFPLPQGTQFYLVIFLAAVLPITLPLPRLEGPGLLNPFRKDRTTDDRGSRTGLAAVAFAVCIYPLFDFDGYLERRQAPTPSMCWSAPAAGAVARGMPSYHWMGATGLQPGVHRLRVLRRLSALHLVAGASGFQLRRDHRAVHHGHGRRSTARRWRSRPVTSCCSRSTAPYWTTSGKFFIDLSFAPSSAAGRRPAAPSRWPASCWEASPASVRRPRCRSAPCRG